MANGDDQAPDTTDGNPFSLLAYVLFQVRHALEDQEDADRPPRWVRIARGSPYKEDAIGSVVSLAVNGMGEAISYMAELTLDLEELLYQTDAAKAMGEVMLRLIQAASDPQFQAGINAIVGTSSLGALGDAMDSINDAASDAEEFLEYIPEPEDVRGLGHELYRLLCLVQEPVPRTGTGAVDTSSDALTGTDHLVMEECGKVRLCAWAYAHGVTTRGIGADEEADKELFVLGARRLYQTGANSALPQRSEMEWADGENEVTIFDLDFDSGDADKKQRDIKELVELLTAHGYNEPAMDPGAEVITPAIRENLMKFQHINELLVSGELDNDTLNRLMNLDFARKNLRRATPLPAGYSAWPWDPVSVPTKRLAGDLAIINPGADEWEDEGLSLVPRIAHPYYAVPTMPAGVSPGDVANWPEGRGWLSETGANLVPGFVVLRSRARNREDDGHGGRFLGGKWSEGEASRGHFFFAARHTEPWVDGRTGAPTEPLFPGQPSPGSVSRMYQWIPLPAWLDQSVAANTPDGTGAANWELHVYASVLQRSLFTDRGGNGYPDQGLIRLEVYGSDVYTAEDTNLSTRNQGLAKARSATDLFPDHTTTTDALSLDAVDRKRLWTRRATEPVLVPSDAVALCLVAEGVHQSAYDIDAYFDDFRVHYEWREKP